MSSEDLAKVDAVAFDCDGVLIDARRSYDRAIVVVAETMVKNLTGVRLPLAEVGPELIATIRRTGGFNNDWDSTYALTFFAYVSLKGGEKSGTPLDRLRDLTARFGAKPRKGGVRDADSFLDEEFPAMAEAFNSTSEYLGYPGTPPESRLATLFDELYFGASLYEKAHGLPGRGPKRGFIELERLLVKSDSLLSLERIFGKGRLAIITGRPSLGTAHALGKWMMGRFDQEASIYIGDADLNPGLRADYAKFRKPSPEALVRAGERFAARMLLYAGDSAEDLMMVKDAKAQGRLQACLFAGVYGMSPQASELISFFDRGGADLIVKSVNDIPARLMASRKEGAKAR